MTDLNSIWQKHAKAISGLLEKRPSFRFDPRHYANINPDLSGDPAAMQKHYEETGRAAGATPNTYKQTIVSYSKITSPSIDEILADLAIDPDLQAAIESKEPGATELLFELINLGSPVDADISDFSLNSYNEIHPDVQKANINPLVHYLCHGVKEGRRILRDIRKNQLKGQLPFHPARPTCLIAIHECSRTGAPIVGRDLAREASKTHNVIVAALSGGLLLDELRETSCVVLISANPYQDFDLFQSEFLEEIDFAIVNSAVAWNFIPYLVAKEIPFAGYLHEYAEYLHPAYYFSLFPMFADLLVFSSDHVRNSWRGRMMDINFNVDKDSTIIPQRPLYLGNIKTEEQADAKARLSQLIGRDLNNSRIVCGAGQSQWRKGTDIFTMTAQICKNEDKNTFFIWIGHEIVPDELGFGTYMAYHMDQVGLGTEESNMAYIPAGPAYFDVLKASDAMFMSSRLDPLPNVVFDALEHGCQIVLFEGASGFSDEVYCCSDRFTAVEYGNPGAAAKAILSLQPKETSDQAPEMPDFDLFDMIRSKLEARLASQRYFVRGPSQLDIPILYNSNEDCADVRVLEREKMMRYGRRRVWRDLDEVESTIAASDNWMHSRMWLAPYQTVEARNLPRFSLHLHAYYIDDLENDIKEYAIYHHAHRILVTTDSETKGNAICKIMNAANLFPEIEIVSNTGRDILPFINLFQPGGASDRDELWCHLHQKKSIGSADEHKNWRRFLMRVLLGDEENISSALTILAQDDVGLVAPFDPHFVGWNESRRLLPKFADRLPGPMPENPLLFPVGNMFWVRRQVVESMLDLFGPDYPWPEEPIANDGSVYHFIERLWPAMATKLEMDQVFVHKLDEKRI